MIMVWWATTSLQLETANADKYSDDLYMPVKSHSKKWGLSLDYLLTVLHDINTIQQSTFLCLCGKLPAIENV